VVEPLNEPVLVEERFESNSGRQEKTLKFGSRKEGEVPAIFQIEPQYIKRKRKSGSQVAGIYAVMGAEMGMGG